MVASKDQVPAIYERAVKKYKEITDETLDMEFLTKIQNVQELTKEIDERNTKFLEFREKRGAIFDVLQATLIPVQLFGDLMAGGASMVFPPSSLVFGAVTYLMGAAKGVSESYNAIHDLMGTLKDFTIRLKVYSKEDISEDLGNKLSDILVTLVEIFALSTKTICRGRLLKLTRNFLLGSDDAIQAAMGKLDNLTRVEACLVGAETLTELKRTGRAVDSISATVNTTNTTVVETGMTVNQMSVQVNEVQEMLGTLVVSVHEGRQENSEDREKSLQVLVSKILQPSKTDSAQDWYNKINKARIPGTGDWVQSEAIFQAWLNKQGPIIFLSGNPGAGKSYLATNIVSFLREQYPQNVQSMVLISVGYFFFKDDNPNTRSIHQALRDLAFQISLNDPVYQKYLATVEIYEKIGTLESAWRLLFVEYFLKRPNIDSRVYILLDAVDEAWDKERMTFFSLLRDLYDAPGNTRLQLVVVGRPHISDQLLEGLEAEVPTIHVTTQKNSSDINQYIHASIKKSVVLRRVSSKLHQEIVEKLSAGAEGMFLWVNLMLQELVKKRNETSIRNALEHPPKGLQEILCHVLSSFSASSNEEELEYLNEVLLWVACSNQPLTLAKIDSILRLKSPEGDGIIYLEGLLRRQFASFFNVDREDGLTTAELYNMSRTLNLFDESGDERDKDEDEEAFADVENFTDFNSDRQTTTVTFCHASIGDFLRNETQGKVSAGKGHVAVGVNYHEAKAHVLKTLLRLISDREFAKKADDSWDMVTHAARNWVHHLLITSPLECSPDDQKEIAKRLVTAFMSEAVIGCWIGRRMSPVWVSTNASIQAVWQWWKDKEVLESFSPKEREFILSTEGDPITTFKPLVMLCMKKWLLEIQWYPEPLMAVVWSYQSLIKGKEVDSFNSVDPTAEEIVEAAEFGNLEKNGTWYQRCAMVLRKFGHYDKALEYFTKSLEHQPDEWLNQGGMAFTYWMKGESQKAIELYEGATQILAAKIEAAPGNISLKATIHTFLERMGNCYKQLGDMDKRLEVIKQAYMHTPYCDNCINALLEYYGTNHCHKETMDLLRQLADTPVPDKDYSRLTQALWENADPDKGFFFFIADAALATDNLDFMVDSWRTAAREARKALKMVVATELELGLAQIYNEFLHDQAKATKRWEKIMSAYASTKEKTQIGFLKLQASVKLARQYLYDAVDAGVGSLEAEGAVAKLERLVKQTKADEHYMLLAFSSGRALSLGIYYRLNGQEEEARALFRPSIKQGIQLLSDDDLENDSFGLFNLMNALLAAGDARNVIAGFYVAIGSWPGSISESVTCDGPCRRTIDDPDNFALCPICYDTGFCPDCVKMLAEGTMAFRKCSAKHVKDFIYIPPQPEQVDTGTTLVDGEKMDFREWMNQLRKEWDV
ncbi:hypothetical protein AJ80_06651 [Polytolypa hystricis UAMH7299]|uniref:NACHT domain-containing protein n=1 Tax=Polytolypa hystricis (strain UAMH7299) TaxID=1447883 RepID=A0A2B7XUZ7_POLH7|nr:hypothetical protein AJ80_06651 [Polytolypa hystricis UAMH7299]